MQYTRQGVEQVKLNTENQSDVYRELSPARPVAEAVELQSSQVLAAVPGVEMDVEPVQTSDCT